MLDLLSETGKLGAKPYSSPMALLRIKEYSIDIIWFISYLFCTLSSFLLHFILFPFCSIILYIDVFIPCNSLINKEKLSFLLSFHMVSEP